MRVDEAIFKSLKDYPSLYKRDTYEESKQAILHHYFIVLGSGIEWAYTKKPEDGGYLTEHQYVKKNGEWTRKYNKPYHKSGIIIDHDYLKKCFEQKLYYAFPKEYNGAKTLTVWEDSIDKIDTERYQLSDVNYKTPYEPVYKNNFNPYPSFCKEYSPFWEGFHSSAGIAYIKDDWLDAAIEHLTICKDFFDNPETSKNWPHNFQAKELEESDKEWKLEDRKGGSRRLFYLPEKYWKGDYELLAQLMSAKQHKQSVAFLDATLKKLDTIKAKRKI